MDLGLRDDKLITETGISLVGAFVSLVKHKWERVPVLGLVSGQLITGSLPG